MKRFGVGYCNLIVLHEMEAEMTNTVNGFPIENFPMGRWQPDTTCARMETALIGEGNTLRAHIQPHLSTQGQRLQVGNVDLAIHARRMGQGPQLPPLSKAKRTRDEVRAAYKEWGSALLPVWREYVERQNADLEANPDRRPWALDSMRAYVRRNPLVISMRFTNRYGPDFSGLFEEAPVIEGTPADTARLTRYALHLRDLMAAKDTAALYEEFRIRRAHNRRRMKGQGMRVEQRSDAEHRRRAYKYYNDSWFGGEDSLILDFDEDDIRLRTWDNSRIWEIYRHPLFSFEKGLGNVDDHVPLFVFRMGNLETSYIRIFVAEINDSLRVVR
jgi:hypothetical protein